MGSFLSSLFVSPENQILNVPGLGEGYQGVQLVFLMAVYGFVLFTASNMISEGSELLLLVPSLAGIVGSVVLPVLGAVPDAAIVLFSGLGSGPGADEALAVGVGALAGSTIMLLTIPWFLAVFAGRVNLENGAAVYKRPSGASRSWRKLRPKNNRSLTGTGISVRAGIRTGGYIMAITCLPYFIIQGPAFALGCGESTPSHEGNCRSAGEKWYAFAGLMMCIAFFIGYLVYMMRSSNDEAAKERVDNARRKAIERSLVSLSGAFAAELEQLAKMQEDEGTELLPRDKTERENRIKLILKSFFRKYDRDNSGGIDKAELVLLLDELGESMDPDHLNEFMQQLDSDGSGQIDFEEFTVAMTKLIQQPDTPALKAVQAQDSVPDSYNATHGGEPEGADDGDDGGDSDGEESVPEDLAHLPPNEQQKRIKIRSAYLMGLGTFLIVLFSDPMVDALSGFGKLTGIPAFYVSFVAAPLASNASELIAAYSYALKKTKKTISISLSALQGACAMNNTLSLGVFLALIFFKDLRWQYSAETISIVFVQAVMFLVSLKQTHNLLLGLMVLSLYPISIGLVILLEQGVGLN